MPIGIARFVGLFLFLCNASSFKIGDYFTENFDDSEPIQYQNELKDLFDAIFDNDTERTEKIFNFFESIDPNELNDLNDLNEIDYSRNRILYVVSLIECSRIKVMVFFLAQNRYHRSSSLA